MKRTVKISEIIGKNLKGQDAVKFRDRYLSFMDNLGYWRSCSQIPLIDFEGIRTIAPSFASTAFGYFTLYASPDLVIETFLKGALNLSKVHRTLIEVEVGQASMSSHPHSGEYLEDYLI